MMKVHEGHAKTGSGTQAGLTVPLGSLDQFVYHVVHFLIRQCALSILHNYPDSKAFLVFWHAFSTVIVKHFDRLHLGQSRLAQG